MPMDKGYKHDLPKYGHAIIGEKMGIIVVIVEEGNGNGNIHVGDMISFYEGNVGVGGNFVDGDIVKARYSNEQDVGKGRVFDEEVPYEFVFRKGDATRSQEERENIMEVVPKPRSEEETDGLVEVLLQFRSERRKEQLFKVVPKAATTKKRTRRKGEGGEEELQRSRC